NATGLDLSDPTMLTALREGIVAALQRPWRAAPIVAGIEQTGSAEPVLDPSDRRRQIGEVVAACPADVDRALARAMRSAPLRDRTPAGERAARLEAAADLFERHMMELMALIIREGGRTIPDALSEIREAVDHLRYYAVRARADFAGPTPLPGP